MIRHPVSSSNLRSVGYDAASNVLEVEFTTGAIYQYFGVPQSAYLGLMAAGSKGNYLADHVKDVYRYQQVR